MTAKVEQDKDAPFITASNIRHEFSIAAREVSKGTKVYDVKIHGRPIVSLVTPQVGARTRLELQIGRVEKVKLIRILALVSERVETEPEDDVNLSEILTYLLRILAVPEADLPAAYHKPSPHPQER